jgi:lipoate-protein ligase B
LIFSEWMARSPKSTRAAIFKKTMSSSFTSSAPVEVLVKRHSSQSPWTYSRLEQLQREIAERARLGGPGALILSELAPVITLGKRSDAHELLVSREELERRGIEVLRTLRGGLATYHGPGQWVLFAVDLLERLTGDSRGVRRAVETLLDIARTVGLEHDPSIEIRGGAETGVWSRRGKIASVGVQVENRVLLHGLSVNGFKTATSFYGIKPCGLDAQADYLLREEGESFARMGRRLEALALRNFWEISGNKRNSLVLDDRRT